MGLLDSIKRIALGEDVEPPPELGRNDTCWCGSGKKYKLCHLEEDDKKRASLRAASRRRPRR